MSSTAKLLDKLNRNSIDARELRTLLRQFGWHLERTKESHEIWANGARTFVLACHDKNLKPYQLREAKRALLGSD